MGQARVLRVRVFGRRGSRRLSGSLRHVLRTVYYRTASQRPSSRRLSARRDWRKVDVQCWKGG